jgi:hypothetical protein
MIEKLLTDQVYVDSSHVGELEVNIRLVISARFFIENFDTCQRNEKLVCKNRDVILNTVCYLR